MSVEWRKNVALADTGYTWDTNLSDDELRQFYDKIREDRAFLDSRLSVEGLAISLSLFDRFVPFRDGFAWCVGFGKHFCVTYRTTLGWEVWEARKRELEELRCEQAEQHRIELLLFRAEDEYRAGEFHEAIAANDYDRAEALLLERGLARQTCELQEIRGYLFQFVTECALRLLCAFPDPAPGLRFLRRLERPYWEYLRFAECLRFWLKAPAERMTGFVREILAAAAERFPDNPLLFKEVCLLLIRGGDIAGAVHFCRLAVERGLRDDTKTGFAGRLKRLENLRMKTAASGDPSSQINAH